MRNDVQYRFLGIYGDSPYEGVFREDTVQTKRSSITASLSSEKCEFGSRPKKAAADSTSAAAIVIPLRKAPAATKRTFSLNRVQSGTCPSYAEARKGARKCTETLPRGKERLIVFDRLADDRRQQGVGYRRRTDTEELRREPPLAQNFPNNRIVEHRVGRRRSSLEWHGTSPPPLRESPPRRSCPSTS